MKTVKSRRSENVQSRDLLPNPDDLDLMKMVQTQSRRSLTQLRRSGLVCKELNKHARPSGLGHGSSGSGEDRLDWSRSSGALVLMVQQICVLNSVEKSRI